MDLSGFLPAVDGYSVWGYTQGTFDRRDSKRLPLKLDLALRDARNSEIEQDEQHVAEAQRRIVVEPRGLQKFLSDCIVESWSRPLNQSLTFFEILWGQHCLNCDRQHHESGINRATHAIDSAPRAGAFLSLSGGQQASCNGVHEKNIRQSVSLSYDPTRRSRAALHTDTQQCLLDNHHAVFVRVPAAVHSWWYKQQSQSQFSSEELPGCKS